ncbi:MAG: hypothetical protein IPJ77_23640 [Planctomycetes bacterium]|nr:hypothetical protein [Planctomycetota bacterium]
MKPSRGGDELERMLDELGKLEREERRAGEELPDAPGLRNVERVLEDVWAEERPTTVVRRWPWILGLAAAALIAAFFLLREEQASKPDQPSGELLNDGVFRIHHPEALERGWPERVTWGGPEGVEYRLVIAGIVDGVVSELVKSPPIQGFEYSLAQEKTESWPKTIDLTLELIPKDGRRGRQVKDSWSRGP